MKSFILFCAVLWFSVTFSQDTLSRSPRFDGGTTDLIVEKGDTFWISRYPNGKIESRRTYSLEKENLLYKRYYPNGNLMWEKLIKNGKSNGLATFYSDEGKKVAEFMYDNGEISDTIFTSPKERLLFGRSTYYSVVHGGMQREDGSSNVSGGHGIHSYFSMYAVKLDSTTSIQKIYQDFYTDYDGYFFLCLENGSFGFFPKSHDITKVNSSMGAPKSQRGMSWSSGWNLNSPFQIENQTYQYLHLHFHSEGYAP